MRCTLFIVAVAFAAVSIHAVHEAFDGEIVELAETQGVGTPAPTMTPTPPDPDLTTAECYANSAAEALEHCNSKITEEQCSALMADWYCDPGANLACSPFEFPKSSGTFMGSNFECTKVNSNAEDTVRPAWCCVWDGGAAAGSQCGLPMTANGNTTPNQCDKAVNGVAPAEL